MDHEDDEEMNPSSGLGEIPIEDYLRIIDYKPKMSRAKKALLALGLMVSAGAGYATPFWTGAYMWDGNLHDARLILPDPLAEPHKRSNALSVIVSELEIISDEIKRIGVTESTPVGLEATGALKQLAAYAADRLKELTNEGARPGEASAQLMKLQEHISRM